MAHAGKKQFSRGSKGKGDGSGAATTLDEGRIGENAVLSNRDKAQHSRQRGLDSRNIQTEQYRDHVSNRR
ncbi:MULTISPECIES: hypothetical protein [unclassified Rhizobium]|jgi:hypothetical protein|uniref:hypothetical protein n=1 Tax=unclassified Rhizobium TaxID=2613769 RepID=UPI00162204D4|nr:MULTISPECIES: hypothetical protein [unclassified Rhizobium]MBB3287158.1 hypothetical protein [Rhizobium sp. BK252]MBB3401898.1 hypothetical protein [Rhizobium sp. BK289]MBB3414158.1 hypothetical protein [Rhizobium sp. BK284]MBB3482045.1 hypothetical protein [Rhizobium sp. BK347]